jgi:tetratricopeptide (TPR) repeat protein
MNVIGMWVTLFSLNIASGDVFFEELDYVSAVRAYEQVLQTDPDNVEALWKLARAHICLGDIVGDSESEAHYRKSEKYARRCIELNERHADAHVWLAAALGSIAMFEGSKTKVKLVREIRKEIDRALVLNPNHDAAYSLLGSVHRAIGNVTWIERSLANMFLGGLPKGGFEEGEAAFKKAIELRPDAMRHQFELGMLYWEWGKKEEAIHWLISAKQQRIGMASDRRRLSKIDGLLNETSPN